MRHTYTWWAVGLIAAVLVAAAVLFALVATQN